MDPVIGTSSAMDSRLECEKPRFRCSPNLGIDKSPKLKLYLTSQKIHEFSGLTTFPLGKNRETRKDKKRNSYAPV